MRIRYRGHSLDLKLTQDSLTVRGRDRNVAPISLSVEGMVYEFLGGTTRVFQLHDKVADAEVPANLTLRLIAGASLVSVSDRT